MIRRERHTGRSGGRCIYQRYVMIIATLMIIANSCIIYSIIERTDLHQIELVSDLETDLDPGEEEIDKQVEELIIESDDLLSRKRDNSTCQSDIILKNKYILSVTTPPPERSHLFS